MQGWACCDYGDNGGCFKGENLICGDDHKCINEPEPECGELVRTQLQCSPFCMNIASSLCFCF